ncbi:DNA-binding protein [Vagococcus carniphilus]|uniref:DNA-binding protein n=1 Tax=Vagococcus carniphilus TaxID=218144 RepID=UPI003BAD9FD0
MSGFQVMLSESQTKELQRYIFELTNEAVHQAIHTASADKEFLNQKEMSNWIGVSVNTLRSYVREGMPMIVIGGRNLYSKKEVSKFLLTKQKGGLDG